MITSGVERIAVDANMALGVMEGMSFTTQEIQLPANALLFLYTDGVTEAMNADSKQCREACLKELVEQNVELAPRDLDAAIRADLATWAAGAEQSDDITILVFRVC